MHPQPLGRELLWPWLVVLRGGAAKGRTRRPSLRWKNLKQAWQLLHSTVDEGVHQPATVIVLKVGLYFVALFGGFG